MIYKLTTYAILAFTAFTAASPAYGETVSQKQAKAMAQSFFDEAYHEATAPVKLVYNGKRLTTDRLFTPFYVYNQPRGGFVIISAENKTMPVLGYSLKSSFDEDNLSETERAWLKGFARDIELIRYDDRVPEKAISAWTDYPKYVAEILSAPYDATDVTLSFSDVAPDLTELLYTTDRSLDGNFSAVYTPAQWSAVVASHLANEGNVAIAYVDEAKEMFPAFVHGRKGDFFRIRFDRPNDWLMLLTPAEFLGDRQIALLSKPSYVAPEEEEEPSFEFYDSFVTETRALAEEEETRMSALPTEPIVKSAAAGHFDILLPENARLAMIYNLNGSHIGRATYSGQPVAHINIEAEPAGFYFAIIYGESGRPYGIKLYR